MSASFIIELDTSAPNVAISRPRWIEGEQLAFDVQTDEPLRAVLVELEINGRTVTAQYDDLDQRVITSPVDNEIVGGVLSMWFTDDVANPGASSLAFHFGTEVALRGQVEVSKRLAGSLEVGKRILGSLEVSKRLAGEIDLTKKEE